MVFNLLPDDFILPLQFTYAEDRIHREEVLIEGLIRQSNWTAQIPGMGTLR
jgi:hypothetical protein